MTDYGYAQKVMEAAGVKPSKTVASWVETFYGTSRFSHDFVSLDAAFDYLAHRNERVIAITEQKVEVIYPDPLTSGDAFLALWDALEAKGWRVQFRTLLDGTLAQVYKVDGMGRPDLGSIFQGGDEDRRVALVEAAVQALAVSRG